MANGKPGRKPRYNKNEHPQRAADLCLMGATNDKLAEVFGVSTTTIDNWIARYDEFREAVYAGREVADAEVVKSLYEQAIGYTQPQRRPMVVSDGQGLGSHVEIVEFEETVSPSSTPAIFWLKNRQGWRDKHDVEHSGQINVVFDGEDKNLG